MSNFVFVLDTEKRPLDPIHPGGARHLLSAGKAAVYRRFPFTVILKESRPDAPVQDLELKLDPGSKVTGIAIKHRRCAYCSVENVPFEIEHIQPKSKDGSDRVSNLTIACHACNQAKGNQDVRDFLSGKPERLNRILKQAKSPLKDATAVNSTRWALFNALKQTGLQVTTGSGGQTKFNRSRLNIPKSHWLDAACMGQVEEIEVLTTKPLSIAAKGHGTRQMCGTDKFGFPIRHRANQKNCFGFQTGDLVRGAIQTGKFAGKWIGRISVRSRPSFKLSSSKVFDVHPKYLEVIHRADGYSYSF